MWSFSTFVWEISRKNCFRRNMVCITHLMVSLFLLVSSPFGISSGFSISSRDSKLSPQTSSLSFVPATSSSTETPIKAIDSTKTQIVFNTEDRQQASSASTAAHNVPLDIASDSSSSSSKTVSVVKREVSPSRDVDGENVNGLYDPSLMIISKKSAAALNKLMLALRSFDEPSSSSSYENSLEGSNKEGSNRFPKVGFRTGGAGLQFDRFPQNGLQRRGQKDRKIYLRCYFNAVSCFRRRK